MREKVSASGRLVAERISQRIGIDGDQQKIALPGKVPFRRLADLFFC